MYVYQCPDPLVVLSLRSCGPTQMSRKVNPGRGRVPGGMLSNTSQAAHCPSTMGCQQRAVPSGGGDTSPVHRETMLIRWAGWGASCGWWGCPIGRTTVWWAGPGARPYHGYRRVQLVGDALWGLSRVGRSAWRGTSPRPASPTSWEAHYPCVAWGCEADREYLSHSGMILPARLPGRHAVWGRSGVTSLPCLGPVALAGWQLGRLWPLGMPCGLIFYLWEEE